MTEQLYRHPTDRAIAGVAGGMAAWLRLDPSLVRVVWVLLAVFSGGLFVLVYLVMMVVVPLAPPGWTPGSPGPGSATWGQAPASGPPPGTWPASGPAPGDVPSAAPGDWLAEGAPAADGSPGTTPANGWGTSAAPWGTPAAGTPAPGSSWTAPKPGNAGIVAGIVLIVVGAWFLVDQFVRIEWDLLWPVIVMVLGVALIAGALMRGRSG